MALHTKLPGGGRLQGAFNQASCKQFSWGNCPGTAGGDCSGDCRETAPFLEETNCSLPAVPPSSPRAISPALLPAQPPAPPFSPAVPPSSLRGSFGELGLGGPSGGPAGSQAKVAYSLTMTWLQFWTALAPSSPPGNMDFLRNYPSSSGHYATNLVEFKKHLCNAALM